MSPILQPLPVGAGRGLLQRLAIVCGTGVLIAVIVWGFSAEADGDCPCFDVSLVYSLSISIATWAAIDPMRFVLRGPLQAPAPDHWPPPGRATLLVLVGIPLGYLVGTLIGDTYAGRSTLDLGEANRRQFAGLIVLSIVVSVGFVLHFQKSGRAEAAARQAREAELALLQSQLEPHMLFNTLANLRVLIATDPARARTMLDRLIGYLRATLSASRQPTHPLADEFERLGDYLALMALRMGPRLTVDLALPDALRPLPVPTFLLQPLVENAIRHGLEPKPEGGLIRVAARGEPGRLLLTVRDTGLGLDAPPGDGTRFGLAQVRARLLTLYGAGATLRLENAADAAGGTLVTLELPVPT